PHTHTLYPAVPDPLTHRTHTLYPAAPDPLTLTHSTQQPLLQPGACSDRGPLRWERVGWLNGTHAIMGATVVQEVKKSFSKQKVASSIPCRSVLEQGTEPLI